MPFLRLASLRLAFVCLLSLFLAVSVQAQEESPRMPTLSDAENMRDVYAAMWHMFDQADTGSLDQKTAEAVSGRIFLEVGDKLLKVANPHFAAEKVMAYNIKYSGLIDRVRGEIDEQKIEMYLNELETFLDEVAAEEALKAEVLKHIERHFADWQKSRFFLFRERAKVAKASPETFGQFKAEFKQWINHPSNIGHTPGRTLTAHYVSMALPVAAKNNVPAEQFIKEMSEYVQSPECTLMEKMKEQTLTDLETMTRFFTGIDPKLYGRTLDDNEFDWESLREKYVLINFTATWCEPCKKALPDMLEAYKKYHDKGLEIVSIYIRQDESDPVATVRQSVEEAKLPWIIISEALTEKAGQPKQSEYYRVSGVSKIVLVGKDGRIIMMNEEFSGMGGTHPEGLNAKLAEIFE